MSLAAALSELEAVEYRAVHALSRLPAGSLEHLRLREALSEVRTKKAALLARDSSILRKGSSTGLSVSLPVPAPRSSTRSGSRERTGSRAQRTAASA